MPSGGSQTVAGTASKVCSLCRQAKPLSDFNRHRRRRDGLASRCRQCNASAGREWYRRQQQETNRLYSTYVAMKGRCHSRNHSNFPAYGGRGITVCEEWRTSFQAFMAWAQSNGYRPDLQLDRIDNDKGYSPDNCRFVTAEVNANNKRKREIPMRNNPTLTVEQVRHIRRLLALGMSQRRIARLFGVTHGTVWGISVGRSWKEVN